MPTPQCPLCSSTDTLTRFTVHDYKLRCCNDCELLFIDPYPHDSAQQHDIVSSNTSPEIDVTDPQTHYEGSKKGYERNFPLVEQHCKNAASVLDVGCGTGYLLKLLAKFPELRRAGIELNEGRARFARENSGCEIHQISFERFSSDTPYDVITFMDVLSHIPSLDKMFTSIGPLLSPDGKVIIKTGEVDSRHVDKGAVYDWSIPNHLQFLGLKTINVICERYGLTPLSHSRLSLAEVLYTTDRFRTPGRSRARDIVKLVLSYTPFALKALKVAHELRFRTQIYSSHIVLTRKS